MLTKYLTAYYAPFNIQINAIFPVRVIKKQSSDFFK